MTNQFIAKYPGQCATCGEPTQFFSGWDAKGVQIEGWAQVVKNADGLHHLRCYARANPLTNETTYKANRDAAAATCGGWDDGQCHHRTAGATGIGRIRMGTPIRYTPLGRPVHATCAWTVAERVKFTAEVTAERAGEEAVKRMNERLAAITDDAEARLEVFQQFADEMDKIKETLAAAKGA